MPDCTHLDTIEFADAPQDATGCQECLKAGRRWVHVRMCHTCGRIGCRDSSPGRHASAHHDKTGHPIVRTGEPGEDWSRCYPDRLMFRLRRR